ncbi:hypothetical protein NQ317_016477 [Molorchus minor]|uniref:Vitellogenin n=1 Tax=Molorchus minor TaxID=1323400 RepID=A0ABQ9JAJ4_9CUCU|nr:hypothetical protein NQ317_016477 [Molorchus minor]
MPLITASSSLTYNMKIDSETEKEITVNISVNPNLEPCVFETDLKDIENHRMCAITIDILPQIIFEEVQVAISVHRPLKVIPDVQFYTDLTEKTSFKCYAYLYEVKEVPSLSVDVITTVISNLGIPKVIQKTGILPMKLALEVSQAQKDAEYKITLNINQSSVPLATLFSDKE